VNEDGGLGPDLGEVAAIRPDLAARVLKASAKQRQPGLSIVLVQRDGGQLVAYEPPLPPPMLDVTPAIRDTDNTTRRLT
jgi:hypothetical protein